jgi:hypothetical protein
MDHVIDPAIVAKYIRINPTSWKNDICLRVEYYGCDGKIYRESGCLKKNAMEIQQAGSASQT